MKIVKMRMIFSGHGKPQLLIAAQKNHEKIPKFRILNSEKRIKFTSANLKKNDFTEKNDIFVITLSIYHRTNYVDICLHIH
jgi:hypothetical protein